MRHTDVKNYVPGAVLGKVDRMSMRHSLEVRTPYLSIEVARFAERLPDWTLVRGRQGKLILREVARRYLPADSCQSAETRLRAADVMATQESI